MDDAGDSVKRAASLQAEAAKTAAVAKEAVERLKRAKAEEKAVEEAFGKVSREAAEARARSAAAEEAAAKATADATRATRAANAALEQAAAIADSRTAPALRRMGDALSKVSRDAERAAQDLRVVEAQARAGGKSISGFINAFAGGLAAGAVGFALDTLKDGIRWAAEHNEKVGASFGRLGEAATRFGERLL
ncbi:MAG TPA: hypothetical protein VIK91_21040, partial [Nannocystis sp.]